MPRLDGEGLIGGLSSGRPETTILVMSDYMNADSPPKATVLRKPFDVQTLVKSVSGALHEQ